MDSEPSQAQIAPTDPAADSRFRIVRSRCDSTHPTEGMLYFGNQTLFTLEQPWQDNEPNVSCIPDGEYPCVLAWSNRYKKLMPRLLTVPGRQGILIHPGNFVGDTHGCVLIGTMAFNGAVYNSQAAFLQFYDWLQVALKNNVVTCEITTQTDWSAT